MSFNVINCPQLMKLSLGEPAGIYSIVNSDSGKTNEQINGTEIDLLNALPFLCYWVVCYINTLSVMLAAR